MKKLFNILAVMLSIVMLAGLAIANPINIESFNVEQTSAGYQSILKLSNDNVSAGEYSKVSFYIKGMGTVVEKGVVVVEDTLTLTYSLRDIVEDYNLLKQGESYTLVALTDDDESEFTFLYGNENVDEVLGLAISKVEINGIETSDLERINVLNGEDLTLDLYFEGTKDIADARLRTEVSGYEHEVLSDTTEIFNVRDGDKYTKSLSITLPSDMNSEEAYVLRVYGVGGLSGITYKEYSLFVDTDRHRVDIIDFITTPSSGIEAGQNVIANVRVKNRGQNNEGSVKVRISIPELDVSESSYISTIDKDEAVTSDDLLLFVPESAAAGTYDVAVSLTYNDGHTSTVDTYSIEVLPTLTVTEKGLVVSFKDNLDLTAETVTEMSFVIANPSSTSKVISIVPAEDVWANIDVEPSLRMIQAGADGTFNIKVTPKADITGEQVITLYIKEENKIVDEIDVKVYVAGEKSSSSFNWTNIILAGLLIIAILVLLSLVAALVRKGGNDSSDEENSSEEEYY